MSDLDEATQRILERAHMRRMQRSTEDADENTVPIGSTQSPSKPQSPVKSEPKILGDKQWTPTSEPIDKAESAARRSKFSALAQEFNAFENEHVPIGSKPKEAFRRGTSPRLSQGETRPAVLFSPSRSPSTAVSPAKSIHKTPQKLEKVDEREERSVRFAYPIARATIADESSTLNEETSTTGAYSPRESLEYADQQPQREDDEEYGAHTFLKKSPHKKNTSSSSLIGSPKPFSSASMTNTSYSPVHFDPGSASSPIVSEAKINISHTVPLDLSSTTTPREDVVSNLERTAKAAMMTSSPSSSQITPSTAKHFFAQLPMKSPIRTEQPSTQSSPVRSAALSSAKATQIRRQLEEKIRGGESQVPIPSSAVVPGSARSTSVSSTPGVRTQWRGSANTPVVAGADKSEPTKPDVRASNLKSLRNRWEFSSATGTPIHPDKNQDELLEAARKMSEQSVPSPKYTASSSRHASDKSTSSQQLTQRFTPVRINTGEYMTSTPKGQAKSATSSPVGKSPRYAREEPEAAEEDEVFDEVASDESDMDAGEEASRIIDKAFGFMGKSPSKSTLPPMAPFESAEVEDMDLHHVETKVSPPRQMKVRSPKFRAPPPPAEEEEEPPIREEENSDSGGSGIVHTVSFYRKRRHDKMSTNLEKIDFRTPCEREDDVKPEPAESRKTSVDYKEEEARIRKAIYVQEQQVQQAMAAISRCRQTLEFRGSREEVDAQRACLVANETRRSLLVALDDLRSGERAKPRPDGPRGVMDISSIALHLTRDFGSRHIGHDGILYYFIILVKFGSSVQFTQLMSSEKESKGVIEFRQYLKLEQLPPDFQCMLEVYSLRTRREQLAHEDKYKLKTGTLKKKSQTLSYHSQAPPSSSSGEGSTDSAFQLIGRLKLDINSVDKKKFQLQDVMHPLDGTVTIRLKRYAMEKGNVLHRGFLSLYQRTGTEGLASWTRYWCVLENGELKFWRSPEDEADKQSIVCVDLSTCASRRSVEALPPDVHPFPNSFHVDVLVPRDVNAKEKKMDTLRIMMAADRKEDLVIWLDILNKTIRNLLLWNTPLARE